MKKGIGIKKLVPALEHIPSMLVWLVDEHNFLNGWTDFKMGDN